MRKSVKIPILIVLIWFIAHEIIVLFVGLTSTAVESEFAVVLGNKVNADGTLSERLKARVNKAFDLYSDSIVHKIVVSGGLGKEGFYEAQKMAAYLILKGVPQKDIFIDDEGNNTWLTAKNFKKNQPQAKSVVIVTQYFHISRTKLAFKKVGLENISAASPHYFEWLDAYSLIREFPAYYFYLWHELFTDEA